jgi:serine/threonine protein kinase
MNEFVNLAFRQGMVSASGATYVNLQHLGTGGTAETYLTLATSGMYAGQLFAVKVFRRLSKPDWRDNFLKEVEFLERCAHPSVMRVFDRGLYLDEHPFVVAEYLPTTLARVLRTEFSVVVKLSYSLQLLSALEYLGSLEPPVIHRDIKPANVFIKGGSCVLGDFGLMKRLHADRDLDRELLESSHGPRMPPSYRTPDLVNYLNGGPTPTVKSDVFQLGLVLAELFSGRNPQKPMSDGDYRSEIQMEPIGFIPGGVGKPIKDLLTAMLDLAPENRPPAFELVDDFREIFLEAAKRINSLEGKVF